MRIKPLVAMMIGFAIVLICAGIFKQEFILSLFGIVFAWQSGWGYKLISSLKDFPGGDCKTMEHWKVVPSLILMAIAFAMLIFAFNLNSYLIGILSIIPSFFCGFNVRVSYEKKIT